MYLASGYGVNEAMVYANSLANVYNNTSIQSAVEVYNTEWNLKIGKYATLSASEIYQESIQNDIISNSLERRNILNKINNTYLDGINLKNDNEILDLLVQYNNKLSNFEYEITRQNSQCISVKSDKIKNTDYINVNYKIGDFITNAGYVIQIDDGNLVAIYENNIEKLLDIDDTTATIQDIDSSNYDIVINKNIEKILNSQSYNNETIKIETEKPYYYYYDVEKNKKYIVINYISEISIDSKEESTKACGNKYIEI